MIIVILFISLKTFNDFREKDLDDLIGYQQRNFNSIGFTKNSERAPNNQAFEWYAEEQGPADELIKFLSQYRVKRTSEENFGGIDLEWVQEYNEKYGE